MPARSRAHIEPKRRRWRVVAGPALLAVVATIAAGCGSGSGGDDSASGKASTAGKASTTIKVGLTLAASDPTSQSMDLFAKKLAELSDGRIKVNTFPNGVLGTTQSQLSQVKSGGVQMAVLAPDYLAAYFPPAGMWNLPYLFDSADAAYGAADGPVGKAYSDEILKRTGIRIVGWEGFGFRDFLNRRGPITTPESAKGLKLRVLPSPIDNGIFQAIGITPINMDFSEVYTSIQTGTIDGVDSPPSVLASAKLQKVAKYLSETEHQFTFAVVVVNNDFYEGLSSDDRAAFDSAMKIAVDSDRKVSVTSQDEAVSAMRSDGAVVNELSDDQKASFRAAEAPVIDDFVKKYPDQASWVDQLKSASG